MNCNYNKPPSNRELEIEIMLMQNNFFWGIPKKYFLHYNLLLNTSSFSPGVDFFLFWFCKNILE